MKHVDIVAEIGINHNGSLETALEMIKVAKDAGCDYVKFQKRDPDLCVPEDQKSVMRDTPWGRMTYIEYKHRMEFDYIDYDTIAQYCRACGMKWFMSVWDEPSLKFAESYNHEIIKIPSALNEDIKLIERASELFNLVIVSTGMLTFESFDAIYKALLCPDFMLMHAVSAYPLEDKDANLAVLERGLHKGYSDHTKGIHMAVAAVGMGATMIEKHITLDRTMWGTDQSASLEPDGLRKMVRNIRSVCAGWGDGSLKVRECEKEAIKS